MGRGLLPLAMMTFLLSACSGDESMSLEVDDPVPMVDPEENPDTGLECAGDRAECMQEDIEGE